MPSISIGFHKVRNTRYSDTIPCVLYLWMGKITTALTRKWWELSVLEERAWSLGFCIQELGFENMWEFVNKNGRENSFGGNSYFQCVHGRIMSTKASVFCTVMARMRSLWWEWGGISSCHVIYWGRKSNRFLVRFHPSSSQAAIPKENWYRVQRSQS